MRPVEIIARAMAKVESKTRWGDYQDQEKEAPWIERHWPEYESAARAVLRALKGQPPHVIDAGNRWFDSNTSTALDAMFEAMARS